MESSHGKDQGRYSISWRTGSLTYSPSAATRTLGGTTSISGGITLLPKPITITPNPYPLTTPKLGSTDPVFSKIPSYISGMLPTPTATPTLTADCKFWNNFVYWIFEIYNIDGWGSDNGASLKDEEGGCGVLTGWEWYKETLGSYMSAYFNFHFFIKTSYVERVIVSSGGPKISCDLSGTMWKR